MSLPVKKIYIDSLHRVSEASSSSNFKTELPYSNTMPHNAIFLMRFAYLMLGIAWRKESTTRFICMFGILKPTTDLM